MNDRIPQRYTIKSLLNSNQEVNKDKLDEKRKEFSRKKSNQKELQIESANNNEVTQENNISLVGVNKEKAYPRSIFSNTIKDIESNPLREYFKNTFTNVPTSRNSESKVDAKKKEEERKRKNREASHNCRVRRRHREAEIKSKNVELEMDKDKKLALIKNMESQIIIIKNEVKTTQNRIKDLNVLKKLDDRIIYHLKDDIENSDKADKIDYIVKNNLDLTKKHNEAIRIKLNEVHQLEEYFKQLDIKLKILKEREIKLNI
ncbi:hypothetical protein K502DRAFT_354335 [Neoconidiobolus thromboides FSU 785]|nr:hypothetical protein K502DRAFT_354335 [Neoconidiobolus thromboides FSU 785]